tara:strand:- start:584 stop:808 length:225 start_codon:yes stop_codon:yes gene_type:complete
MKKFKIFLSLSFLWIILIGYLVWVNGLLSRGDKSFRWDEWIWFGLVPGFAPYIFYFIWRPEYLKKFFSNGSKDT